MKEVIKKINIKDFLSQIIHEPIKVELVRKKPSKGELFKKTHGYSKTMKSLMSKSGLVPGEHGLKIYKKLRKDRKAKETRDRQIKHLKSAMFKRTNKKVKNKKK